MPEYTYEIEVDDYPESPREWDNLGTVVLFHNRYVVPNETDINSKNYNSWDEIREAIELEYNPAVILPVYGYDHSCFVLGTFISPYWFHSAWDSGQVGFIFVSREKVLKEYGWKKITADRREKLEKYLDGEIETLSQYFNGEVYCIEILDPDGEVVESCGGFFGYDYAKKEAEDMTEYYNKL